MPLTKTEANKILLAIAGASQGEHYRQPAIFIGEEFLTRIHHKEDAVVVLTGSLEMRDVMLEAEPKLFYITDHYRKFPALLARLSGLNKKACLACCSRASTGSPRKRLSPRAKNRGRKNLAKSRR